MALDEEKLTRLAVIRAAVTGELVERARDVLAGAGRTPGTEPAPGETYAPRDASEAEVVHLFPVGEHP